MTKEEEKKKKDVVFKMFRAEIKAVDDKREGVIDVLIPMSTGSVDRHGESIDPKGWKKSLKQFKKRAILLSSHAYAKLTNQIGELLDIQVAEAGLLAKPKYYINEGNEEADWGYKLALKGMAAFSVGFIPIKWEDSDGKDGKPSRTYLEQELVEISQVTVPSNRDAIQEMRSKSSDDFTNKLLDDVLEEDGLLIEIENEEEEDDDESEAIELEAVEKPYPNEHSCRIRPPGDFQPDSFRRTSRVSDGKKYSVIMGRLKGETTLTEQAYRYGIKVWTVAEAKVHCKDHKGILFEPATGKDKEVEKEDKGKEVPKITLDKVTAAIEKSKMEGLKELFPELNSIGIDFIFELIDERKVLIDKIKELEKSLDPGKGDNSKETEGSEDDDTVIEIEDDKKDDEHDEEEDEKTIEVDEEIIAKVINEKMGYVVGKVKKDPAQK